MLWAPLILPVQGVGGNCSLLHLNKGPKRVFVLGVHRGSRRIKETQQQRTQSEPVLFSSTKKNFFLLFLQMMMLSHKCRTEPVSRNPAENGSFQVTTSKMK
ncbi:hypothetical protein ILYODFUR_015392 [Ilyodon furcidens]|uniref:Secreted protein n=1 Tax=Ilyodon furcidens TaxID=33524 RepID=A0ABV0T9C3_9TELE